MREFEVAIGRAGVPVAETIKFKLGKDTLSAKPPTTGQLALFLRGGRELGFESISSLFEFMSDVLDDADWRKVEGHLRDGLDVNILSNIAAYLIGEWSGRPTVPSSNSSPTRSTTGRRSTAKQRSRVVKTSSSSPSTDSAMPSSAG